MSTVIDPTAPWVPRHAVFDPRGGASRQDLKAPLTALCLASGRIWVGTFDGRVLSVDARGHATVVGRHERQVTGLEADPREGVISASTDGTLRRWNLNGQLSRIDGLGGLGGVAALRDGRWVTPHGDGTTRLWEPRRRSVENLRGHQGPVTAVTTVPGGNRVLTGGADSTLILWDLEQGDAQQLYGHVDSITALAVGPGGLAVSTSTDGTGKLWDLTCGRVFGVLRGHQGPVQSCAIDLAGRYVATGGQDGVIRIWAADGTALGAFWGHRGAVTDVCFSHDGRSIYSVSRDRTLRRWRLADMVSVYDAPCCHPEGVRDAAWDPAGRWVASAGRDGIVGLWDVQTGSRLARLDGHDGGVNGVAVSSRGQLASVGNGGRLCLWDPHKRRQLRCIDAHPSPVTSVCYLDADTVVTGGRDRLIRAWSTETGHPLWALSGHLRRVRALAVSGRYLASASYDGTVRLWSPRSGRCEAVLEGHTEPVVALASGPGWLASGSVDRTVRIWQHNRCTHVLDQHDVAVTALTPLPDGTLMSATTGGTLRTFDPHSGHLLAQHHLGAPFDGLQASEHGLAAGDRWGNVWFLRR